ncbi:putative nuclease [Alloactinosynnema sp. L-07]|uniref:hypothetical protein n=1 Tax=Alloactinosynnema sp. L-07 TaxID=1653480 RepID=UPI00065EF846|nr:hypothetical protein [Alloactinosynnema sp. L-07]CRK60935.1 putative nuclease [Alloactinosynnema sp. L-07]
MTSSPRPLPARVALGLLASLFAAAAFVADGPAGMLIALALLALAISATALIAGHARWAFVPNRARATGLAAVAIALLLTGGALLPAKPISRLAAVPSAAGPAQGVTESLTTVTSIPVATTTVATTTVIATTPPRTTTTTTTTTSRPKPTTTTRPAETQPVTAPATKPGCDASYPTLCLPGTGPDLDCKQIPQRRFPVRPPDRHRFDDNGDGVGCER